MSKTNYSLCANAVVRYLQKDAGEITREDLMRFATENGIRMVNFMYPVNVLTAQAFSPRR